ncbi:MAG: site-specific integrase [Rhodocyclaceae bacterium]|nr:site-specific integrase [Rhodocyclaceae bacterium]
MVSKTFARRADAEAWARQQEAEMDRGAWRDRTSADATTLHALLERYLKDVVPEKRGAETERLRIKTLMRDPIALYKLSALNPLVLADWRDRRLAAGCKGATVNRELNIVSAVINWARRELMFAIENPVACIRRPAPSKPRERRLEPDEEARLLAALEDHDGASEREDGKRYRQGTRNPWIKPLVLFALETAMRRGELLSLRWEHVDLRRRTAHLPETKNGEARTVPLSSRAVAVLESLPRSLDGRVFPVTANALKLAWVRATKRAGLEDLHFHDLRHEATSRLAEKLPNVVELSAVTGHKDLRMLKRYYHPRAEDLARKLG